MARLAYALGYRNHIIYERELYNDFYPYFYIIDIEKNGKCRDFVHRYKNRIVKSAPVHSIDTIYIWDLDKLRYVPYTSIEVYRIAVPTPANVRDLRERAMSMGLKVAQSAIPYSIRVSLDHNEDISFLDIDLKESISRIASTCRSIRILALDIEYNPTRNEVLIGASLDGSTINYFRNIIEFSDYLQEHVEEIDYIVGYNIYGFDQPLLARLEHEYMEKTGEKLPVSYQYKFAIQVGRKRTVYIPIIDLYSFVDSGFRASIGIKSSDAYALDDVCDDLGIASREELEVERQGWKALIEWSIDLLRTYLGTDVKLTHRLAVKILPIFKVLEEWTGITVPALAYIAHVGASPGKIDETLILRELEKRARILVEDRTSLTGRKSARRKGVKTVETPDLLDYSAESAIGNVRYLDSGKRSYVSQQLKTPAPSRDGVYRRVLELDFSALYPTVMYSFKISPFISALEDGIYGIYLKMGYRKLGRCDDLAMRILEKIFEARRVTKWAKKELKWEDPDKAVKILANASFGFLSRTVGMGLTNELASGLIFQLATEIFHTVSDLVRDRFIYGDTDSLFLLLREDEDPEKLAETINSIVRDIFGEAFELKVEELWDWLILFAGEAKNYIKLKTSPDSTLQVVVKGGSLRKEIPPFIEENLDRLFRMLLEGYSPSEIVRRLLEETGDDIPSLMIRKSRAISEFLELEEGEEEITGEERYRVKTPTYSISNLGMLATAVLQAVAYRGLPGVTIKKSENDTIIAEISPLEARHIIVSSFILPYRKERRSFLISLEGEIVYEVTVASSHASGSRYGITIIARPLTDLSKVRETALKYVATHSMMMKLARISTWIRKHRRLDLAVER